MSLTITPKSVATSIIGNKDMYIDDLETLKSIFPNYKNGLSDNEVECLEIIKTYSGNPNVLENSDAGIHHLKQSSKKGMIKYKDASLANAILGFLLGDGFVYGDKIVVNGLKPNMTLGEAEKYFNLPDGALEFNYTDPRRNYKNQKCNGSVVFLAKDFAENNDIDLKRLKSICK